MENTKKVWVAVLNQSQINVSLVRTLLAFIRDGRYMIKLDFPADSPISNNRNQIVQKFLDSDFDYLLQIDSDIVPPDDYLDLVEYLEDEDKDVISGVCYAYKHDMGKMIVPLILQQKDEKLKKEQKVARMRNQGLIDEDEEVDLDEIELTDEELKKTEYGVYPPEERDGLVQCDAVGTGAILTSREVLEAFEEDDSGPFMDIFDEDGVRIEGLDLSFCRRAREKGFDVWAHLDYRCEHHVTQNLMDVHDAIVQLQGQNEHQQ